MTTHPTNTKKAYRYHGWLISPPRREGQLWLVRWPTHRKIGGLTFGTDHRFNTEQSAREWVESMEESNGT